MEEHVLVLSDQKNKEKVHRKDKKPHRKQTDILKKMKRKFTYHCP